jgi:hypothetical protein
MTGSVVPVAPVRQWISMMHRIKRAPNASCSSVTGCNAAPRRSGARIESGWCGKIAPDAVHMFISPQRELPLLLTTCP